MKSEMTDNNSNKEAILQGIINILADMTADWDMEFEGAIGSETKLISDLEFESIDVVQFIVAIEEHFKRRGLPFEELLMIDGRYVDEIKVADTVAFLDHHFNNHEG